VSAIFDRSWIGAVTSFTGGASGGIISCHVSTRRSCAHDDVATNNDNNTHHLRITTSS
jgi:hypothetical protein